MKSRTTIIWLLVLISIAAFAYYYEIMEGKKRRQAEQAAKKIFTLSAEEINQIQTNAGKGPNIRCVKTGAGNWEMLEPVATDADDKAIKALIASVLNADIQRVIEAVQDSTPYGLSQQALRLTLTTPQQSHTVLVGETNPTGDFVYAKRESENDVLLLPASIHPQLAKDVYALRDKQIIKAPEEQVSRIGLKYAPGVPAPQTAIWLNKNPGGDWQITRPINAPADNKEVRDLLYILDGVHAKRFVAEKAADLAPYGLDNPRIVIEITMSDNKTHQTLLLGKEDTAQREVYAKRQNRETIFALPQEAGEFLNKSVFDLRDKKLLSFSPQEVNKLELIKAGQNILLERKDEDSSWKMLKPEETPARRAVVDELLNRLSQLQAWEFIDQPHPKTDYGFARPVLQINLRFAKGDIQSLLLGNKKPQTELTYVRAKDKISLVTSEAIEQLKKRPSDFKHIN